MCLFHQHLQQLCSFEQLQRFYPQAFHLHRHHHQIVRHRHRLQQLSIQIDSNYQYFELQKLKIQ
jgi:hypothetical protein